MGSLFVFLKPGGVCHYVSEMPVWPWRKMSAALEAHLKEKVTRGGLLFTATIVLVAVAAFVSANNLLFLLLAMLLATLLVSGFLSRLDLAGLELEFVLPEHISARQRVAADIVLHNEKSWMPSFSIRLTGAPPSVLTSIIYFPVIPAGSKVKETVGVVFNRRGTYRENGFQFSTRFPFGFVERHTRVTLRRDILVYPSLEPQSGFEELLATMNGEIETWQRGRGSDFYRIRTYDPLESARHVDWKATAHTGELQVREFAREQDPLVEIFLDLAAPGGDWFERAVDCCAFLAWHAAQRECRLRFRTQDFDISAPAEGDIYSILKYLALAGPKPAAEAPGPTEGDGYRIVFTARPETAAAAGWGGSVILGPGTFPAS